MKTIRLDSNRSVVRGLIVLLAVFRGHVVSAATLHVWQASPSPAPPFTNWATAAHTIQDAVDAAAPGDEIVVTNGMYATGGRAVHGRMTNRVVVDKAVTVRSVKGPWVTLIQGHQVPGTIRGDAAIRCVYLAGGAVLRGFTLTNGATRSSGDQFTERSGGGALGGGLERCILTGNSADWHGGGAYHCRLNRCILTGNSAAEGGGAAYATTLNNCIVYYNRLTFPIPAEGSPRLSSSNYVGGTLNYCCTTPMPTNGVGNITNEPRFVNMATGNLRLQPGSPCIDAGTNAHVSGPTDLDGCRRLVGKTVDMGAYEF